ncbi:alpha/beta fold hydrolase [Nocardia gamkensis]|uniref:alpha/beta fold hydrolase n=1 Tax=Nocardia gamkensis TaxID=352869 RepID=UPI0036E432FF
MTRSIAVDGVEVRYADDGHGKPVVFVHGAYVTGSLWGATASNLAVDHRCISPTWPFGAHARSAGRRADLGVVAAGQRIAKFLELLSLRDVTLVANDTGGGVLLSALGASSLDLSRISKIVLTNCDSFEHFPPKEFAPLVRLCRISDLVGQLLLKMLTTRRGIEKFVESVSLKGIDPQLYADIFGGFLTSAEVRRDAVRFTADLDPRYTLAAVQAIENCSVPVLILWGADDPMFPLSHAERLGSTFPRAAIQIVNGSRTYVMVDQPEATAESIRSFVGSTH